MKYLTKRVGKKKANPTSKPGVTLFLIIVILFSAGCVPQVDIVDTGNMQTPLTDDIQSESDEDSSTPTPGSEEDHPVASPTSFPAGTPADRPVSEVSVTFVTDADAYVRQSEPNTNFGGKKNLRVDRGNDPNESLIRFTILQLPGTVQNARLRLYTASNSSKDGPAVHVTGSAWSEEEVTWSNRPEASGEALDNQEQMDANTWVEYDVTPAVTGQGSFSFLLTADSGDAVAFSSRDGNYPPELVVTFLPNVPPDPPTGADGDITLVGAGDISMCSNDNDELTAALLDDIPGTVFTTGDNAYPDGAVEDFKDCYDPTWGRHKDRTKPVPGNHDYHFQDGSAYFQYFNDVPTYYAYNLGSWRIYALNSEIDVSENSPQTQWLKLDLALNPSHCVLAYWHQPRWSSGSTHGSSRRIQALWETLEQAGVELVLNGHEHNYERFTPMDAEGNADAKGLREIVVGTGGGSLYPFGSPLPTSEIRDNTTFGVLKLTLHSSSYDWEFISAADSTFTDRGSAECH